MRRCGSGRAAAAGGFMNALNTRLSQMLKVSRRTGAVRLRKDVQQPYMRLAKYSMPHHHTLMPTSKVRCGHLTCHAAALRVLPSIIGWLLSLYLTSAYADDSGIGMPNPTCVLQTDKAIEITLPGTKIKVGTYLFRYADPDESELTSKMGAFLPTGQFLYVEGSAPDIDAFNVGGDTNFGLYGNYLVVDSFAYGSSYSRRMFLFTYTRGSVHLLDTIDDGYAANYTYSLNFMTAYDPAQSEFHSQREGYEKQGFNWMDIKQRDQDMHPEIRLLITSGTKFDSFEFELFVEVAGDRLHIDRNPQLYESLFKRQSDNLDLEARVAKSTLFYIYGFLTGKLRIDEIKMELQNDKEVPREIVHLLESVEDWDEAFHRLGGAKPQLNRCDAIRR